MVEPVIRKIIQHEAHIDAPLETIFPLLCPIREYEWIDGWNCQLLHSDSGVAEKGAVFTTDVSPGGFSIWTVSHYVPPQVIEFVVVYPHSHVMVLEIELERRLSNQTRLLWTCTYTSLTISNVFMANIDQESFDHHQAYYDQALEYYCKTGMILRRNTSV